MNKAYLKTFFSILCIVLGFFTCIFCLTTFKPNQPIYILTLILTLSLFLVGIVSFILTYRRCQIIKRLKTQKIPYIAKWYYTPKKYRLVEAELDENHYIRTSVIFLLGVLSMLIIVGFVFSETTLSSYFFCFFLIFLLLLCGLSLYLANKFYAHQLNRTFEVILSDKYIYFNGELHGIHKGFYFLENVQIIFNEAYYLQFIYGAPGTPYSSFTKLTIPIPREHLAVAYTIQNTYLQLIHTN